jgi:AmpD protein
VRSPHFGPRPGAEAITLAIVHSISLPPGEFGGEAVQQLFTDWLDTRAHPYYAQLAGLQVSAHFFIRRGGAVVQFVSCDDRAWHAGASHWRGRENCNDWSIGIELEGLEGERFESAQYRALIRLLSALVRRYPLCEVVGHEHVAPGRKRDPGARFRWPLLRHALPSLQCPRG